VNARTGHSQRKKHGEHVSLSKLNSTDISSCVDSLRLLVSLFFPICNLSILDKICGSKNWGGPIYRKPNDGRSPSRRRHSSNIYFQKDTHEQLAYPLALVLLVIVSDSISCRAKGIFASSVSERNLFANIISITYYSRIHFV